MSAYLVSRETIDLLVVAAMAYPDPQSPFRWWHRPDGQPEIDRRLDPFESKDLEACDPRERLTWTPAELGQCLWGWNLKSVLERYQDTTAETWGAAGVDHVYETPKPNSAGVSILTWQKVHEHPNPVHVLKSLSCLRYQSCEFEGWDREEAWWICAAIEQEAIRALPGWSDAPWGVSAKEEATP